MTLKHTDWTRRPTPIEGVPIMAEGEEVQSSAVIAPSTTVSMSARTFVEVLVALAVFLGGIGGTYYALASTDKEISAKQAALQKQIDQAVTKQDLRALRLDIREDLFNASWSCDRGSPMKCRISLPRQAAADVAMPEPVLP